MQATLWISTISEIASMGMPKAVLYFAGRDKYPRNPIYHCLILVASSSIVATLLTWPAWGMITRLFNNPALKGMLLLVMLTMPFKIMNISLMNSLVVIGRVGRMSIISSAISPLILIGFGLSVYAKAGISAIFILTLSIEALQTFFFLLILLTADFEGEWKLDFGLIKSILAYCGPLMITIGTLLAGKRMDSFLIASYFDPSVFAIYSRGALELPFAQLILFNVAAMLMPDIARFYKEQKNHLITSLIQSEVKKNSLLLFPAFFSILLVYKEFIVFLYSEKYVESAGVFMLYLILIPIQLFAFDMVIQAMNKSTWVTLSAVISIIVNLLATLGLMNWMGPLAPAMGMLCSIASTICVNIIVINRKLGNSLDQWLPWKYLLRLLVLTGVPMAVLLVCKRALPGSSAFKLFFYPTLYYILIFPMLWKFGFLPDKITAILRDWKRNVFPRTAG